MRDPWGRQSRLRLAQRECLSHGEINDVRCALCGGDIDYRFTRAYPNHLMSATARHVGPTRGRDPLDPTGLAPVHRCCRAANRNYRRKCEVVSP
jgi:hypothetical protein